jgi:FlaA1/EpsC-like NDP-sugar epimerase
LLNLFSRYKFSKHQSKFNYKLHIQNIFTNLLIWYLASFFSILLRYEWNIPSSYFLKIFYSGILFTLCFYIITYIDRKFFGPYVKLSTEEWFSITRRFMLTGSIFTILIFWYQEFIFPKTFPLLTSLLALGLNTIYKNFYAHINTRNILSLRKCPIAIYGFGEIGSIVLDNIKKDSTSDWKPVLIFDDSLKYSVRKIDGIKFRNSNLRKALIYSKPQILVICFSKIKAEKLEEIKSICDNLGVEIRLIPTINLITGREIDVKNSRPPTFEELIGKTPLKIDSGGIFELLDNKVILITGAGGSIGSELARQVINFNPKKLYLLDRDESALLKTKLNLLKFGTLGEDSLILADIRDQSTINEIFALVKPEIVYHAAALKHVSMLEKFPNEALKTNVVGTLNLLKSSINAGVEVFVNISTDKAADPISVLGKSKLYTERATYSFALKNKKRFMSVRFGNVFGSRGSFIEVFQRQIEFGLPLTISHPEVSRFFMTLEEAVYLVLQASSQGNSGETLILNMGKLIKIKDIAEKFIKISGKNIPITYKGLDQGEKLHEQLIGENEELLNSELDLIRRVQGSPIAVDLIFSDWVEFLNYWEKV